MILVSYREDLQGIIRLPQYIPRSHMIEELCDAITIPCGLKEINREANAKEENTVSLEDNFRAKWVSRHVDVLEFLSLLPSML